MRIREGLAVVSAVAFVTLVACGGGASSSCDGYLNAAVSYAQKCGLTTTVDNTTKTNFEKVCTALSTAPGANNFAGQVDQCASRISSLDCNGSLACPIKGTLADGAACGAATQCAGGICNTPNTQNPPAEFVCGTCASYLAVGTACANGGQCDPSTGACTNGTCVAFVAQGQSCAAAPCGSGLQCDTTSKTCQPYPTKGAACTFECAYPYRCSAGTCVDAVTQGGACPTGNECAPSLTCDPQTKTCVTPTLAPAGQPCGFVTNQFIECQTGLKCAGTQSQTCIVPKAAGATCVVGNGECQVYLACVNGTCQLPDYASCK